MKSLLISYVERARAKLSTAEKIATDYRIAKESGLPPQAIAQAKEGKGGTKVVAALARIIEDNPAGMLFALELERSTKPEDQALWRWAIKKAFSASSRPGDASQANRSFDVSGHYAKSSQIYRHRQVRAGRQTSHMVFR